MQNDVYCSLFVISVISNLFIRWLRPQLCLSLRWNPNVLYFVLETSLSISSRTGPKGVIWCIMHVFIPIACVYSLHMYLYTCIPVYYYNLLYIVFNINNFSLAYQQMAWYLRISLNVPQDIWTSHWQRHLVEVLCTIFRQHAWTIMEVVWVRNCLAPDDKLQIHIKFVICTTWLLLTL